MKFKVDENLPERLAELLRAQGHDACTVVMQGLIGTPDERLWETVAKEGRILVTQDVELADVRRVLNADSPGLVLLRFENFELERVLERMRQVILEEDVEAWAGSSVTITFTKVRIRKHTLS